MVFPTPIKFDENELFVLSGLFVLIILFIKLPRHFPPPLSFVLLLFNAFLAITVDFILAANYPYNFYDALDTVKYDFFDFIMDMFNYALFGYFFMYFYDKIELSGIFRSLYFLFWICISLLFEWTSVKFHVFNYINWHLGYSLIAYFFILNYFIFALKIGKFAMERFENDKK